MEYVYAERDKGVGDRLLPNLFCFLLFAISYIIYKVWSENRGSGGIIRDIFVWIVWKICIFARNICANINIKYLSIMKKINLLKGCMRGMMLLVLFLAVQIGASAFTGSDLTSGQKYYLFNIYQAKFLGADNKLQAPNIGTPVAFTASATGFTIDGTAYTAKKNAAGYYQLKSGGQFFAFEDKVADPANPGDENRAMYLGGGVTCKNTTNDTDRSYWQLISETEYAEWQAKKKFTVSSLNVDGMPKSVSLVVEIKLNPDATEKPGAQAIGRCLLNSGFDVVGVSENFNYHGDLWDVAWNDGVGNHYNAMTHRGSITVGNATLTNYFSQKPLFDIDGLNVYYRIDGSTNVATPSDESWKQWNEHNGYTDQGADGLIKKGYRYYLITLADGTEVDLYTMHMDADDGQGDRDARASQLQQLVAAIKATHNGRPIIIIGDSNCRYTRDTVKRDLIDAINADERFTIRDPWIQYGRNGIYPTYPSGSIMASTNGYLKGEVVDKIWYINNTESNIRLVAETYCQDLSFVASEDVEGTSLKKGSPLCDHKPCAVTFSYHDFDAAIDDQPVDEKEDDSAIYLRNRGTGRFLKSGGAWGTHSVVGNYPIGFNMEENNGKYALHCEAGYVSCEADNTQTFVDTNNENSVKDWELIEQDGFYVFAHNGRALSANDPYYFNDDPNYRWVILDALNPADKLQQWEVLTKDQMMEELQNANAENPVNASWLMSNPNFDRNFNVAKWDRSSISTTAKRMTCNFAGGLNVGGPDDNLCAEAYVGTTNISSRNTASAWEIHQTLTNIPNGYYIVHVQAFQKKEDKGAEKVYVYANDEKVPVMNMWDLKEVTSAGMGVTKDGNYYYPNSMDEASKYFNAGYYLHTLTVEVTDGTLKVGIKKDDTTSYQKYHWTCFDNFQLYYFGAEKPTENLGVNVIAETRKAEMVDGALTLSGTWREADMAELSAKISENSPLLLDASANNFLVAKPEVVTAGAPANMMIKVANADDVANTQNVIANGQCANFVLTDKEDFAPQQGFVAGNVNYTRTNTQGYNTVCMPFDLKVSDFPETCEVYTFSNQNENTAYFVEAGDDIPAGTPVLVKDAAYEWEMALASRNVVAGVSGNTADEEAVGLNGAFVKRHIDTGYFKLNSAGTKFVKTTNVSDVFPFRFYLKESTPSDVKSIAVAINGEETSIEELLNDPETKVEATYDINGRKVISITRPGLYIQGGKKVYVK